MGMRIQSSTPVTSSGVSNENNDPAPKGSRVASTIFGFTGKLSTIAGKVKGYIRDVGDKPAVNAFSGKVSSMVDSVKQAAHRSSRSIKTTVRHIKEDPALIPKRREKKFSIHAEICTKRREKKCSIYAEICTKRRDNNGRE